jgi:hypothetical protein
MAFAAEDSKLANLLCWAAAKYFIRAGGGGILGGYFFQSIPLKTRTDLCAN